MARGLFLILVTTRVFAYTATLSSQGQPLHFVDEMVQVAIDGDAPAGAAAVLAAACQAWSALPESRVLLEPGAGVVRVRFRVTEWPYEHELLALTTVQSHSDGVIAGAIVEVNQFDHHFEIGGARAAADAYDLQAVLTHELGHVLGLGHSMDAAATMFATTRPWDTHQQAPSADDRAGIAYLYEAGREAPALATSGCSISHASSDGLGLVAMLLLAASLFWRQRQANPRAGVMALTKSTPAKGETRERRALR